VTDVPDDAIARAVEHAVQGHGELHGAQAGGQVAAGLADAGEDGLADLVRQRTELAFGELSEVGGL